jgi:hypothetical protein
VSTTSEGKSDMKTAPKSDYEKEKGDSGSSKTDSSKKDVRGGVSNYLNIKGWESIDELTW